MTIRRSLRKWLNVDRLRKRLRDKRSRSDRRELLLESLEARMLLDGAGLIEPEHPFPDGLNHPDPQVRQLIANVTTDAPPVELYAADGGQLIGQTVQSAPLINLDAFRSDSNFVGIDGSGYATVVMDTGIDLDHPFFGPDTNGDNVADRIVFNRDFISGGINADDVNGHGSNVASIMASQDTTYTGMAPGADIIALQVLDDFGLGNFQVLEQALQWVVANADTYNIASVNMSLSDARNYNTVQALYNVDDEIAALTAMDIVVVAAAGNDFAVFNGAPGVAYPAADQNAIAVSAVWDADVGPFTSVNGARDFTTGPDRVTSFSQRHPSLTTVMAPGGIIEGAAPGGGVAGQQGTSQASPHIAGVAVLAQQLAERELGRRLTTSEFSTLMRQSGVIIFDGDDEDDNVNNTNTDYPRIDVHALGNAILALAGKAVGPRLISVNPNDGDIFNFDADPAPGPDDNVLNVAPTELVFRFDGNAVIDAATLDGIRITRSGNDGDFTDGDEEVISPGFIGFGESQRIVVARFAETLPDDLYKIEVFGHDDRAGNIVALRDRNGLLFEPSDPAADPRQETIFFELDLGAQVVAVTPQPVSRDASGQLVQARDQIEVYFNDDDLDPATATDPAFYQLIYTNDTVRNTDDLVVNPMSVTYDPGADKAVLTFAFDLSDSQLLGLGPNVPLDGTYRLRIGTNEGIPLPPATLVPPSDPGSKFDDAEDLSDGVSVDLDVTGKQALVIQSEIRNTSQFRLDFPGAEQEIGHREIKQENHLIFGADGSSQISQFTYTFDTVTSYGTNHLGQPLFSAITEAQKQRAREVFALYGYYMGADFVEVPTAAGASFWVVTGDLFPNGQTSGPGGTLGVAGGGLLIMDSAENWDDSFGTTDVPGKFSYMAVAMHEIGHLLGLGHMSELPPDTIMGGLYSNATLGGEGRLLLNTPVEPVFPGLHDILHGQFIYRPDSRDIDLYKFDVPQSGIFTAEVIAERQFNSSLLDSQLILYRETTDGSGNLVREVIAQNDDYFSEDSFLELNLEPGTYYLGISASGNDAYDPSIEDSGLGGVTQGAYDLKLNFRPQVNTSIVDTTGVALDGDNDGVPGGVYNFWFQSRPVDRVVELLGGASSFQDGQTFRIIDAAGVAKTFEFDSGGGVAGGNVAVDLTAPDLAAEMASSINGVIGFGVTASSDGSLVTLSGERNITLGPGVLGLAIHGKTIFVDKSAVGDADGSLTMPFNNISRASAVNAFANTHPGDIVRIVGNGGLDNDLSTESDAFAYEIGFGGPLNAELDDGFTMDVPKGVTVMVDAGAVFKLRRARIGVGSSTASVDRSKSAIQVLGTPENSVFFTSYNNEALGVDTNPNPTTPFQGDWGGISIRQDVDLGQGRSGYEREGIFLNYVNHAVMSYGGGSVNVNSISQTINPVHINQARPTVSYNVITASSDAALSADPNSFEEATFNSPTYQISGSFTADYNRVGPQIHGNRLVDNSNNALFVRIESPVGGQLVPLSVAGRFDDTDVVHVITEVLQVEGTPAGPIRGEAAPAVDLVTQTDPTTATLPNGSLGAGQDYDYRLTFVDRNGYETVASAPTRLFTSTGNGSIRLETLPPAPSPFVARRLYRSAAGGGSGYTLVAQLDGTSTRYLDDGTTLGGSIPTGTFSTSRPRPDARLVVDPGTVLKMSSARIQTGVGAQLIAEGLDGHEVIFTSLKDDRFGAGGTFDTNNNADSNGPVPGDWGGLFIGHTGSASIDHALISFAGGITTVEGSLAGFNAVEIHQARARIANSIIENNDAGIGGPAGANREGRGFNEEAVIFVRAAQPVIVNNIIRNNTDSNNNTAISAININANSLDASYVSDPGRSRGFADRFTTFVDNQGPLVRLNQLSGNEVNGMEVRGETLNTESVWDDTDIVHVLPDRVYVTDFTHSGGLRLESNPGESLVVKLTGQGGFSATGRPLDIDDRIGGALHIVGVPGFPVILTSLADDSVGAGFDPEGQPQNDTNNNGPSFGTPGDWDSVRIDQFAHDRNVEMVIELEAADATAPGVNADPNNAQLLGTVAPGEKSSDDNLRLGFTIQGLLNAPGDVDVYSFTAKAGTEVWFDIDHTNITLDSVIDLLDANGNLIAQSDNSLDESDGSLALYHDDTAIPANHVNVLQKTTYFATSTATGLPRDDYSTNPRDAGMRVVLPGDTGAPFNTYHVRVRSSNIDPLDPLANRADLQDPAKVFDGLTFGNYELNIRTGERDEIPGSTIRYADIRFATNGIEVIGQPIHSPLIGEGAERLSGGSDQNNGIGSADALGNLMNSDLAALSVAGNLSNFRDVDFYSFSVGYDSVQSASPGHVGVTIDLDYSDAIGRANTTLAVFNSSGQLMLVAQDSNIADDQPGPFEGNDMDDLSRGSAGNLDPFIGTTELPVGNYTLAVISDGQIANQLLQTKIPNPPNPNVRLEPVNSTRRIAEAHIERDATSGFSTAVTPVVTPLFGSGGNEDGARVPFELSDVVLFVNRTISSDTSELVTVDPFTGQRETTISRYTRVHDIAMRPDGELFGFEVNETGADDSDANNGNLYQIDTAGDGTSVNVGDNGIVTYELDANNNAVVAHDVNGTRIGDGIEFEALAFGNRSTTGDPLLLWGVGNRGAEFLQPRDARFWQNILYKFDPFTGAASSSPANNRTGAAQATQGAGTQIVERGFLDTRTDLNPLSSTASPVVQTASGAVLDDGEQFNAGASFQFNFGAEALVTPIYPFDGEWFRIGSTFFEFDTPSLPGVTAGRVRIPIPDFGTESDVIAGLQSVIDGSSRVGGYTVGVSGFEVNFVDLTPLANDPTSADFLSGTTALMPLGGVGAGTRPVNILKSDSPEDVARRMADAINAAFGQEVAHAFDEYVSLVNGSNFTLPSGSNLTLETNPTAAGGVITGIAFVGSDMYAVSSTDPVLPQNQLEVLNPPTDPQPGGGLFKIGSGSFFRINDDSSFNRADYIETSVLLRTPPGHPDGANRPIDFVGLAAGPRNTQGGKYADLLFGLDSEGYLYAFDTNGVPQRVFKDGNYWADTNIRNATGLDFSNLDVNLWHTTDLRRNDPGHGEPVAPDGARRNFANRDGGQSLYFGFQDPDNGGHTLDNFGSWTGWLDPVDGDSGYDTGLNNTYDFPGGAHGTIVSNEFDLTGIAPEDKPVLYFNYFIDTEKAADRLNDGDTLSMRDAIRVLISGDDGVWHLLGTNNSERQTGQTGVDEYDFGLAAGNECEISNSPTLTSFCVQDDYDFDIGVQQLFDINEDGAPVNWRQARVSLAPFAGQENLKLRFDFSTAGAIGPYFWTNPNGFLNTVGDTLYAVAGTDIQDGDTFRVDGTTFEFDMGVNLVAPTGKQIANIAAAKGANPTFNVDGVLLEFTDGTAVTSGAIAVSYADTDTAAMVATSIENAINTNNVLSLVVHRDAQRLNLVGASTVSTGDLPVSFVAGQVGVSVFNVPVKVDLSMPDWDPAGGPNVRDAVVEALADTFAGGETNAFPTQKEAIKVIGHRVGSDTNPSAGPLGLSRYNNAGQLTRGVQGDQFSSFFDSRTVPGATRGQNNRFEGVYIDDIIIGVAERGELVVDAQPDDSSFVDQTTVPAVRGNLTPGEVGVGEYQVEIRRSAEYATSSNPHPTLCLTPGPFFCGPTRAFGINERLAQQVTLVAPAGADIYDGQRFTIGDGIDVITFEYDDDATDGILGNGVGDGVDPGNVAIVFTVNDTADRVAERIRDAVNGPQAQTVLDIKATLADGTVSGTVSTSNLVNLYGNASGDLFGGSDFGEINVIRYGLDTASREDAGDQNRVRPQGQILIQSNIVRSSEVNGILVDAGTRSPNLISEPGTRPHPGSVRNLRNINNERLAPGVTVINNVVTGSGQGGILVSGEGQLNGAQAGAVPFGRVVNNTVYGSGAGTYGIRVEQYASPTVLNNILANVGDGIIVDGTSGSTVISHNLYQNVNANRRGSFAEILSPSDPLFVDPSVGNFYLKAGSRAIDNSLNQMEDRFIFANEIKAPMGIAPSPILAPDLDALGQPRVDDPFSDPTGQGSQVFKDRGAIDRSDSTGPIAVLKNPLDNDREGRDVDPNETYVQLVEATLTNFSILITDADGTGPDPTTITNLSVTVTEDGVGLIEGIDYTFGFSTTNNTIRLTPLSRIWRPGSAYEITLNNRDRIVIVAPDGAEVSDGDQFTISDVLGSTTTFEFESGYSLFVPETLSIRVPASGAAPPDGIFDGDSFTITYQGTPTVFEFDSNNSANSTSVVITFDSTFTADDLANAVVTAILNANVGLNPKNLGGGIVHLGSTADHQITLPGGSRLTTSGVAGGVADGDLLTIDYNGTVVTYEFDSDGTVAAGNVTITILDGLGRAMTHEEIADEIVAVVMSENASVDPALALQPVHLGDGHINLQGAVGYEVDTSRTGLAQWRQAGVPGQIVLEVPGDLAGNSTVSDGEQFTISRGSEETVTFEFDNNFTVARGTVPVLIVGATTVDQVAASLVTTLAATPGLGLSPMALGAGQIMLSHAMTHAVDTSQGNISESGLPGVTDSLTIQVPSAGGAGVVDGSTFTIQRGLDAPVTFEFNSDGNFTVGNQLISYSAADSQDELARKIASVISGITALGNEPGRGLDAEVVTGSGEVRLNESVAHRVVLDLDPAKPTGLSLVGVAGGAVPVEFVPDASFTASRMAGAIINAINFSDSNAFARLRGSETIFLDRVLLNGQGVSGITNFRLNGIKDVAGNNLQPNRPNNETQFTILLPGVELDYGDAPDPVGAMAGEYATLLDSNGARHVIVPDTPLLGSAVDADADGQPTLAADGDGADEDGVAYVGPITTSGWLLNPNIATPLEVTATADGLLDGWVDFNRDGDWDDAGEKVFDSVAVEAGVNELEFSTPVSARPGTTYVRFRISAGGGLFPRGAAIGGEVEDYVATIIDGTPPVPANDFYTTDEDTSLSVPALGILTNDVDAEGDPLLVFEVDGDTANVNASITLGSGAELTVNADGSFTYDPTTSTLLNSLAVGETVTETFTYRAVDQPPGNLGSTPPQAPMVSNNVATVTIEITGVNDPPVANDDSYTTDEDTVLTILDTDPTDLLSNDQDVDASDTLTVTLFDATSNLGAAVTVDANGGFVYDPTVSPTLQALVPGDMPVDWFTYTIEDTQGATATATVSVTVNGLNDAPVANGDSFATDEDTVLTILDADPLALVKNDTDADAGDTRTVVSFDAVSQLGATVTVNLNSDGGFSYDPTGAAALQALAGNTETLDDSFTYTIEDSRGASATGTVTVTVSGINDAPVLDLNGLTNVQYIEDAPPVALTDPGFTASDIDSPQLSQAVATITNPLDGADEQLAVDISAFPGVTATFASGVLTISGVSDVADYQQILRSLTYRNLSQNPDNSADRLVTVQVTDNEPVFGSLPSAVETVTVTVVPVNDAPVVDLNGAATGSDFSALFIEDGGPVLIVDPTLSVTDVDSTTLVSAEATITNLIDDSAEVLSVNVGATGINAVFTQTTGAGGQLIGVLTLTHPSGSAPIGDFESVLRTLRYESTTDDPTTSPDRLVTVVVDDGSTIDPISTAVTSTVEVRAVNDAPVLDNTGEMVLNAIDEDTLVNPGTTVRAIIDSSAANGGDAITDVDRNSLEGLAVIAVDNSNGQWQYSLDGGNTWIDFTGAESDTNATLLDDAAVIRFVPDRDFPGFASSDTATIEFRAWDRTIGANGDTGVDVSVNGGDTPFSTDTETATITVNQVNDAPVVDLNGANDPGDGFSTLFVEPDPLAPVAIADSDMTITEVDSVTLSSATITLENALDGAAETLLVDVLATGLTANYTLTNVGGVDQGVLTLTGTASVSDYQDVLRTVQYQNTSQDPDVSAPRTIMVVVDDGEAFDAVSTPVTGTVTIQAINDAPVLDLAGQTAITYTEDTLPTTLLSNAFQIVEVDSDFLQSARVVITNPLDGDSEQLSIDLSGTFGLTASYAAGVLNVTGLAEVATYVQVLRTVTYANTSQDPNAGADRNVTVEVTDFEPALGSLTSLAATVAVTVVPINDAPLVDLNGGSPTNINFATTFVEDAGPVTIVDSDLTVTDVDSPNMQSAVVTISNLQDGALEQLTVDPGATGLVWTFTQGTDPGTGQPIAQLMLTHPSGSAPIGDFQQVLRTLTYENFSDTPDPINRLITVVVRDESTGGPVGSLPSPIATSIVAVIPVNDEPVVDLNGSDPGTGFEATYVEDAPPVAVVDSDVDITDGDGSQIVSATVTLQNSPDGTLESLSIDSSLLTAGMTLVPFDPTTGELTITGAGTHAEYEAVLASLSYQNASQDPDPADRLITLVVDDGETQRNLSTPVTATVHVQPVNDPPIVDLNGPAPGTGFSAVFVEDLGAVSITASALAVTDVDDVQIASAKAKITNLQDGALESLLVNTSVVVGIQSQGYDPATGELTLTGAASLPEYNLVLRTLQYLNTSQSPSPVPRLVEVTVFDGQDDSLPATSTIDVMPVNDAPVLHNAGDMTLPSITEDDVNSSGATVADIVATSAANGGDAITDVDNVTADPNFPEGIAVIDTMGNGTWQYQLDGGSWNDIGLVANTSALLLRDIDRIRYVPDQENGETATIVFRAWDQTTGVEGTRANAFVNGGTSAFSSSVETATITVTPINDPPVANDVSVSTSEDGPQITEQFDATDVDDTNLTFTIESTPAAGTVVNNQNGSFRFDPGSDFQDLAEGQQRQVSFTYRASDDEQPVAGLSNVATVAVTVTGLNDRPIARDESFATDEDTILDVSDADPNALVNNDSDVDAGDLISVVSFDGVSSLGAAVTVNLNGRGGFVYDPTGAAALQALLDASDTAVDTFRYTIADTSGETATATVTVTVSGVNDNPVVVNDFAATNEDLALAVAPRGVLRNDSDPDAGQTAGLQVISAAGFTTLGASYSIQADGSYQYDPTQAANLQSLPAGAQATDTFTYEVLDGQGGQATGTVTVTVLGSNDVPRAVDDPDYSTDEDTVLTVPGLGAGEGLLANDSDIDTGDTITLNPFSVTSTLGADVNVSGDGSFTYDPRSANTLQALPQGSQAVDTFTYEIQDSQGSRSRATVTVTVAGQNDAPVGASDVAATNEDTILTVDAAHGLLVNDSDRDTNAVLGVGTVNGNAANVGTQIVLPSGATLQVEQDGQFVYDPTSSAVLNALAAGESTVDTFTYRVSDGIELAATDATVSITVSGRNDAPVADPDSFNTVEGQALDVDAPGLLANDDDPDGDSISAIGFTGVSARGAAVEVNPDGSFQYDPVGVPAIESLAQGESLRDTFAYSISDGRGRSATATVTVDVTGINDVPVANDDSYRTDEDSVLVVSGEGVLVNDVDTDASDSLSVERADSVSALGVPVVANSDGTFTYDPTGIATIQQMGPGDVLTDTFTYEATDGQATSSTATVTITVDGRNDAPTAVDDSYEVEEDGQLTIAAGDGITKNDTDPEGTNLTVVLESDVAHGQLSLSPSGSFTYTPAGNFSGTDTFTYRASDGPNRSNVATVTIQVQPVNDPPVGVPDAYEISQDTDLIVDAATGVLQNDEDPDGDALRAFPVANSGPSRGSLTLNEDGSFTYTPDSGFVGQDSFQYEAFDPSDESTGPVTVVIDVLNTKPWRNPRNALDVNGDGFVSPIDALIVINWLNTNGAGPIPDPAPPGPPFRDVNGSNSVEPLDVIIIIDALNQPSGEGEAPKLFAADQGEGESLPGGQLWSQDIVQLDVPTVRTSGGSSEGLDVVDLVLLDDDDLTEASQPLVSDRSSADFDSALQDDWDEWFDELLAEDDTSADDVDAVLGELFGDA